MRKVTVIIPAHNEEENIGKVIDKIRESEVKAEIIVVDNCSTDKTFEIANGKGVKTVCCENRGKGYAMEAGLSEATEEVVVFMDGDLEIYSKDILYLMVEPILNENVDFTKSAFERDGGRVTELVAKPLLELIFSEKVNFMQPLSGIIAGKKEILEKIVFEKDYGVDIGILLDMINMNAKIKEVYVGKIDNNSQSWGSLSKMAKEVARAILKRADYIK